MYFLIFFCSSAILIYIIFFIIILKSIPKNNYYSHISLENMPIEFEEIYNKLYDTYSYSLELLRKKVKLITSLEFLFVFLSVVLWTLIKFNILSSEFSVISLAFFGLSFSFVIPLLWQSSKDKKDYISLYKTKIIPNFIKLVNSNLTYTKTAPNDIALKISYAKANFDNKPFNTFKSDDHIKCFIDNNTFIHMGDVNIQNIIGVGKDKRIYNLFTGMFVHINYFKHFKLDIKILRKNINFYKNNNIKMDSTEFEKYFDVYSDDKILAMQFLTHDFMECLTDFYGKYNSDFEIVFNKTGIYLRFFTGSMFEPPVFAKSMDKSYLLKYFYILEFILDLSKVTKKMLIEKEDEIQ